MEFEEIVELEGTKNVNTKNIVINVVEIHLYINLKGERNMDENNIPEEELDNIIVLNDETGAEVKFEFLDLVELDGEEYVVLLPADEAENEEEAGEVVILKVEASESDEEESYVSVDDEEVLNKVFEMFKEKFKDEFNFIDED